MIAFRRYLAIAILLAFSAPAFAQPSGSSGAKLLAPFQPIVAKVNHSTLRILCDDKDAALGTVVSANGLILTKASELRGSITVKLGEDKSLPAEIISVYKPSDLALIRIKTDNLKPVTFANSKQEPLGNWLAAAGTGANPIAVGIVSVMTRDLSGFDARETLNQNRGYLGIMLAQIDDPDGGAKIDEFPKDGDSGAKKAGLKVGDVIYEVNGKSVPNSETLRELLENYKPGEKVHVKVRRDGEEMKFTITLGKPKASRSDIQNNMGGELSGRRTGFPTVLQTDMVLDPKNCGGPVVDLDGKVLGISIARAGRVETWILPSETIRPLLDDMIAGKFPVHVSKTVNGSKTNVPKVKLPVAPAPRPVRRGA